MLFNIINFKNDKTFIKKRVIKFIIKDFIINASPIKFPKNEPEFIKVKTHSFFFHDGFNLITAKLIKCVKA